MSVFEFALQMEKDGEAFYKSLANSTSNEGLKNILNMLADDEARHYQIILKIKNYEKPKLESTTILGKAKNIFQQLKEDKNWQNISSDQTEIFKKALEIEEKSFTFYTQKLNDIFEASQKKYFFIIAEEEKRHQFLLNHIIQFITRPQLWLENAEFFHLDQY